MKAFIIRALSETGTFADFPEAVPADGEIAIAVRAVGVNPFDWKVRDGFAGPQTMPLVLGQDFAGAVVAVGKDVGGFAVGDRVFGISDHGSYAEQTLVSESAPIGLIPGAVSDVQAASVPTPGLTALASLAALAVTMGTKLVIHGALGAVGSIATQVARDRGAHVIASVKGSSGRARALGASDEVDTGSADLIEEILRLEPQGVDAVLDLVTTDATVGKRFAEVLKPGGRLVSTNGSAQPDEFARLGLTAFNINMMVTPQASRSSLEELGALLASGKLVVRAAKESPLADAARILNGVKSGEMSGKNVLVVVPGPAYSSAQEASYTDAVKKNQLD